MKSLVGRFLTRTRLDWMPVRVRHGINRGARWTLYPHSAYWRGNFEPEVQAALGQLQPGPGGCAWDLGAHFGFYTLALARGVGPSGSVLAIEPDADSFRRLSRHMELNDARHVRCVPHAASSKSAREFLVQSEGGGATTSHLAYHGEIVRPDTPGRWIETVALDELRRTERLPAPSFIKIDVEGHGAAAVQGARETIAEARPRILMSLHSPEETADTAALLIPLGYRPHDLAQRRVDWKAVMFQTAVLLPSG